MASTYFRPMGGDPQQRSRQVTRKMLESSGTLRWRRALGEDSAISHYDYLGGYVLYEEGKHYTAIPMGADVVDFCRGSDGMLFELVARMQQRIDGNVEPFHCRKKAIGFDDEDGAYADPIDRLACEAEDPADIAVNMMVAEQVMREAFRLMTRKQRKVWIRHRLEGRGFVELAGDLGITRQAVRDCFLKAQRIVDRIADEFGVR